MSKSGLYGAHALTSESINEHVETGSPGVYALGRVENNTFYISYVGRADSDLNDRLKKHAGKYASFKYGFLNSAADAFLKECELFHVFNPPDNLIHPDAPSGSNLKCPHCPKT